MTDRRRSVTTVGLSKQPDVPMEGGDPSGRRCNVSSHAEKAARDLALVREKRPLIHSITNYVVMQYTANALLALGASPVMAHAVEEMEEMASLASALVLNIGTLSGPWIEGMRVAGGVASRRGIPIVVDPVGAGATRLRTDTAVRLLDECRVSVLRGNASEVLAVAGGAGGTRGVDAAHRVEDAVEAARELARRRAIVVAITGPVDHVTDGDNLLRVHNGHAAMGSITGSGCTATAVIAAFCAVNADAVEATAHALAFFGIAGEHAARRSVLPGTFGTALIDMLHAVTPGRVADEARIEA
jgi:hydroxyethylthiazole kinase